MPLCRLILALALALLATPLAAEEQARSRFQLDQPTLERIRTMTEDERAGFRADLRTRLDQLPPEDRAVAEEFLRFGVRRPMDRLSKEDRATLQQLQTEEEKRAFLIEKLGPDLKGLKPGAGGERLQVLLQSLPDAERARLQALPRRERRAELRRMFQALPDQERARLLESMTAE